MKVGFSTQYIHGDSFAELCNLAKDYRFAGFALYGDRGVPGAPLRDLDDAAGKREWTLQQANYAAAMRRLRNRGLEVPALICPDAADSALLTHYVRLAYTSCIPYVIVSLPDACEMDVLRPLLTPALEEAQRHDVEILLESTGALSDTGRLLDVLSGFACGGLGVAWNIRRTYFDAGESAEQTIQNLGAYIRYVMIGDRCGGEDVLLGEGELPLRDFIDALSSLNYDGFLCDDGNARTSDPDVVLPRFTSLFSDYLPKPRRTEEIYYNRARTGTFPWKKYDVLDITFSEVLDTLCERYPDQLAFKYTTLDYTRTYAEFRRDVDQAAAALIALGVRAGHHVAIWATNIPQWFITFWACVKIGAVLVTVNTAYKIHEAEYLLRQSDTHTLIMIEGCKDSDYRGIMTGLCPELASLTPGTPLHARALPFLRNVVTVGFSMPGCLTWEQMLSRARDIPAAEVARRAAEVRPDDVCNMQYTSGTTGFPKGVMLTHRNIINNGKIIGDRMDLSTADRMMIQVPMFHCFGMVLSMTSAMTHGGTLCPMPYFSPKSSLACVSAERITCFNGVPTMFIAMFSHPDFAKTDFSHVRTGIMAGSNCPPELMRRAAEEMHMTEILSVYGQTESSPGCTMGEVNEDLEHRVETVGSAFPGVECRIIDPETGAPLPDGENGEFVARGYNIMKGYYKMPRATAQTIDADGWLHTGDICCRTPDGYYKVTGRLKDMIIRGGENLYPREIEEFYLTHPKVRDVQVVGVPDSRYGEEACAWIILHDGEQAEAAEMTAYGVDHMARHKVPRYFLFVREFPMNAAGKILKYKMREESIGHFHLQ